MVVTLAASPRVDARFIGQIVLSTIQWNLVSSTLSFPYSSVLAIYRYGKPRGAYRIPYEL
jgi:hypothetical protein